MDVTKLRVVLAQHGRRLALIIPAILLFAAGWQTGRAMSPYYAAHPIIFEDYQEISGGSVEELKALQAAGAEQQESRGEVAGAAAPAASNAPAAPAASTEQKKFVGSVNSDLYHLPSCAAAGRIKTENQIWFATKEEAEAAGYKPSKCTQELIP